MRNVRSVLMSLLVVSLSSYAMAAGQKAAKAEAKPISRSVASVEVQCSGTDPGGYDADYVIKQIEASKSCYDAIHIAESCGAGSSLDTQIAGGAESICEKQTNHLNKSDADLKHRTALRCAKVCNPQTDGTMCIGQQAFCRLSAAKFMFDVNAKNN